VNPQTLLWFWLVVICLMRMRRHRAPLLDMSSIRGSMFTTTFDRNTNYQLKHSHALSNQGMYTDKTHPDTHCIATRKTAPSYLSQPTHGCTNTQTHTSTTTTNTHTQRKNTHTHTHITENTHTKQLMRKQQTTRNATGLSQH